MHSFRFRSGTSAACCLAFLLASSAYSQTATGTINGRVTDTSGAALPAVEVSATNPLKGTTVRTVTDEQGGYRFFYLEPASYTLTFQKSGFSTLNRENVQLRASDTLGIDIQMNVGSLTEKVDVSSTPPMLETETS